MSQFNPSLLDRNRAETGAAERVEAAVSRLDELGGLSTPEHVEVFESVHEVLSQTLSAVDEA